ncbi:MAG: LysM domain-containing protein [Planctomycetota bacterium]|nr:LysM domain-containing protein [Planctomycetota bacterium]MDP6520796.1 LysM domain-containing protein [Planctomycetota bacterium]
MHRIERYGVIALVLLLVTTAAVALWGSGGDQTPGHSTKREVLAAERSQAPALTATPKPTSDPRLTRPVMRPTSAPDRRQALAGRVADGLPLSHGEARPDAQAALRRVRQGANRIADSSLPSAVTSGAKLGRGNATTGSATTGATAPTRTLRVAPAMAAAPELQGSPRTVTVKAGEVLSVICERELGTVRRLGEVLALNPGLNPDRLSIGQQLRLPGRTAPPASEAASARTSSGALASSAQARRAVASSASAPSSPGTTFASAYTVRPGDVLSLIAERELGSMRRMGEIVNLNPGLDPDRLVVGQNLRMPTGRAAAAAGGALVARASRATDSSTVTRGQTGTGRVR